MQDRVEPGTGEHLVRLGHSGLHELGAVRHGIVVTSREIVEDDHVVAGIKETGRDDRADVTGTAGDQQPHEPTSRSRWAMSSGRMSVTKAPMPDSEPARYFSLSTARRIEKTCRCK